MSTVFVSHSSKDRKVAGRICAALESKGIACWIASRDINPGENFGEAIVNAIRSAKVMLLVFTSNANNSDEIKKELVLAGHNRLIVIPIRVEDVVPGGAFAYELATRQWIDLFDDWDQEMDRLGGWILRTVASTAGPGGGPAAAASGGVETHVAQTLAPDTRATLAEPPVLTEMEASVPVPPAPPNPPPPARPRAEIAAEAARLPAAAPSAREDVTEGGPDQADLAAEEAGAGGRLPAEPDGTEAVAGEGVAEDGPSGSEPIPPIGVAADEVVDEAGLPPAADRASGSPLPLPLPGAAVSPVGPAVPAASPVQILPLPPAAASARSRPPPLPVQAPPSEAGRAVAFGAVGPIQPAVLPLPPSGAQGEAGPGPRREEAATASPVAPSPGAPAAVPASRAARSRASRPRLVPAVIAWLVLAQGVVHFFLPIVFSGALILRILGTGYATQVLVASAVALLEIVCGIALLKGPQALRWPIAAFCVADMLRNLYYYSFVLSGETPPNIFNTLTALYTVNLVITIIVLLRRSRGRA